MTEIPGKEQSAERNRELELIGYLGDLGYAVSEVPNSLDLNTLATEVDKKLEELGVDEDAEMKYLKDTFLVLAVEGARLGEDKDSYEEKIKAAEFNHDLARLLVLYEDQPEVIDKFWKEAEIFFPEQHRGRIEGLLAGIAGEAAVQNYFRHMDGVDALLTTAELDMKGADLLLVNDAEQSIAPVQIKTGSEATFRGLGLKSGIFKSDSLFTGMKKFTDAIGLKISTALQINLPTRVGAAVLIDLRHGVLTEDGEKFMEHMLGTGDGAKILETVGGRDVA